MLLLLFIKCRCQDYIIGNNHEWIWWRLSLKDAIFNSMLLYTMSRSPWRERESWWYVFFYQACMIFACLLACLLTSLSQMVWVELCSLQQISDVIGSQHMPSPFPFSSGTLYSCSINAFLLVIVVFLATNYKLDLRARSAYSFIAHMRYFIAALIMLIYLASVHAIFIRSLSVTYESALPIIDVQRIVYFLQ